MIEQKRDQFRAMGYDAELEIVTLGVQTPTSPDEAKERVKLVSELRSKADNCYASAKELSSMLAALPAPKNADKKAKNA